MCLAFINDLWSLNATTARWTWISGSNDPYSEGVYGKLGVMDARNIPGPRHWQTMAVDDASGRVLLFSGQSLDAMGAGILKIS